MMYYLYIMISSTEKKISPQSKPTPVPSKTYIAVMCEYICKRGTRDSNQQANPVASSNVKPVKKDKVMFIFWT